MGLHEHRMLFPPRSLIIVKFVRELVSKIETHLFITQMPYLPLALLLLCVSML